MLRSLLPDRMSEFKKNVVVVFAGSSVSQLIAIAGTPWLSRLYTPEDYGIYGLFLSIVLVLGTLGTFRYTNAIQIAELPEDAERFVQICCVSLVLVSSLLLGLLALVHTSLISFLNAEAMGAYVFFVPLSVVNVGLIEILSTWLNRNKRFSSISLNRILVSLTTTTLAISWAYWIDRSVRGLLAGLVAGQIVGVIFLFREAVKVPRHGARLEWPRTRALLKQYRDFPVYALPADLLNSFANQLPVFTLSRIAGNVEVGFFNMSNRLLGLPTGFVGSAVSEVFRQRATEDYRERGSCRAIFLKTFRALVSISFVPFLIVALSGPWLFSFVLGAQWSEAGQYSRYLSVMYFLRFCVSPLTYIYYIANKQWLDLANTIYFMTSTLLIFYLGQSRGVVYCLAAYSINYALLYVYVFGTCYAFSERDRAK